MATANFCLTVALVEGLKGEDTSLVLFGVGICVLLLALAFFSRQQCMAFLLKLFMGGALLAVTAWTQTESGWRITTIALSGKLLGHQRYNAHVTEGKKT